MSTRAPVPPGPARTSPGTLSRWLVPGVVVLVVVVLVAVVLALREDPNRAADDGAAAAVAQPDTPVEPPPGAPPGAPTRIEGPPEIDLATVERRDAEDVLALGPVDAPVTLVVFSDYQCTYCARWSEDTFPVVLEYVAAGDLRVEWRDVNIFGEDSERAARAAYAAALQGAFVEYHDALFPGGEPRPPTQLTDAALSDLAGELGLDTARFDADVASPETVAEVTRNAELGVELGTFSTPSFLVGGEPIVGAQPTEVFVTAIDAALAASQAG
ncbi:DsbA family protein [Salana multivorans]